MRQKDQTGNGLHFPNDGDHSAASIVVVVVVATAADERKTQ